MFLDKTKHQNNDITNDKNSNSSVQKIAKVQSKLSLNFEYKFFREVKQHFYDDARITSESDLECVMSTCLNECIKQFNMVKNQNQFFISDEIQNRDDYDEEDELNMIELEYNFMVNLLNVSYRFKESFDRITGQAGPANTKKLNFYHYMSALISIYLDACLDLNSKIRDYKIREFREESLKESLCLNTYFLLDSSVYYICNCVLQLEGMTKSNFELVVPIIEKLVADRISSSSDGSTGNKISRSFYLRVLLISSRLNHIIGSEELQKFKKFKKFITKMEIPRKLMKFTNKILKNFCARSRVDHLLASISQLSSDKSLRKFIISKLTPADIQLFIHALHNKTIGLRVSEDTDCYNYNTILNINDEPISAANEENRQIEDESNNPPMPFYEDLNISSSSELTQYDVMSYDDINFSEEQDAFVYDIIKPIEEFTEPSITQYENNNSTYNTFPQPLATSNSNLLRPLEVKLRPLNLEQYEKVANSSYDISRSLSSSDQSDQLYLSPFKQSSDSYLRKMSEERIFSSRKKYEAKERSPSKETITRLNLFRNIYDSESEQTNKIQSRIGSDRPTAQQFYKLNENVSVLLNIDDSPKKTQPQISAAQKPKRKISDEIESANFVQTKLNFKIQKSIMNASLSPVVISKIKDTRELLRPSRKKKESARKPRSYKKVDYKALPKKDYTFRQRSPNKCYVESPN